MAVQSDTSTKHVAISKANAQMVAVVAVSAFIAVFCLVAAKAVFSQNQYQARVTKSKQQANDQLKKNLGAFDSLKSSYADFDAKDPNIINGALKGGGDNDGSNSKIILDALPPTYDFPALTSSIEKILTDRGFKAASISGTDDQLNQQDNISSSSPEPVAMPFTFTISNANYASVQQLVDALEHSVRPIQIDSFDLIGGASSMSVTINGHTYYQPAKNLNITKKVIK